MNNLLKVILKYINDKDIGYSILTALKGRSHTFIA